MIAIKLPKKKLMIVGTAKGNTFATSFVVYSNEGNGDKNAILWGISIVTNLTNTFGDVPIRLM